MLPDFIVIGAMKSGTTSLHHYLNLHPEISMSNLKEIDFFSIDSNWKKGVKWYESYFTENSKIRGESSTSYSKHPAFDNVAKRMYSVLPNVKLIYLIRDPIERIVSHYIQNYSADRENRTISKALKGFKNNHYIYCSKYYYQLQQYLKYYNSADITIITSNDLLNNRRETLRKIFKTLKVNEFFYCPEYSKILHNSKDKSRKTIYGRLKRKVGNRLSNNLIEYKRNIFLTLIIEKMLPSQRKINRPKIDNKLLVELIEYLKDDVTNLRRFSGMAFPYWSV
jgi:hypothetical protein